MSLFSLFSLLRPVDRKSKGLQRGRRRRDRFPRQRFLPRLEVLECRALPSTLTVLNNADNGDGSLRAMLALASRGDTINFDASLTGQTITLTSGELVINESLDIEGLGASHLTVSGNDASRIFDITTSGVTVTLAGLTITHGRAAQGGAIHNAGGNLRVSSCTLSGNLGVMDESGVSKGGAIFSDSNSQLTVTHSTFMGNTAIGGAAGQGVPRALGGAIYNRARATVTQSSFFENLAFATLGAGLAARGGAIYNGSPVAGEGVDAVLTVTQSSFTGNQARGSSANPVNGGGASGGAISNGGGATLIVTYSTLSGNQALGGDAGTGVGGLSGSGAINNIEGSRLTISYSVLSDNQTIGGRGIPASNAGGRGSGGAIGSNHGATNTISHSTFTGNQAIGGAGADGTDGEFGEGGAIEIADQTTLTMSYCVVTGNQALGGSGGAGGNGGQGRGGAIAAGQSGTPTFISISHCTITDNQAVGGHAGAGGNGGAALGGGIYSWAATTLTVDHSRLTNNQANGGLADDPSNNGQGIGGGIYITPGSTATIHMSVVESNHASTSDDDVFGDFDP
jgi:hypothetical protein